MLSVRIHREHMSESGRESLRYCGGNCAPLPAVVFASDQVNPRIFRDEFLQRDVAAIRTPIDYHPNRIPICQRIRDRLEEERSGVVAGNEDEMRSRGYHG